MHVMIATDGSLDAQKASKMAAALTHGGGRVTVFTAVEVPREVLDDMRLAAAEASGAAARRIDPEYLPQEAADDPIVHWFGDDAAVSRYVESAVVGRTAELAEELDNSGVEHTVVGLEGEDAARSVLEAVAERQVDVLCIGTHGLGRFEGLLGSTSTKLARLAPCSVMLVR